MAAMALPAMALPGGGDVVRAMPSSSACAQLIALRNHEKPLRSVTFRRSSWIAPRAMSAPGKTKPPKAPPPERKDPLRSFPWDVAVRRFTARMLDLVWTAGKWLSIPILLVSSASELSYALIHGKALFVPLAMLVGIVMAGVMKETALELSQDLQNGFPWHLLAIGVLFALIKLPGPVYPFWGRIILPHFANGGLWQTCYLVWRVQKEYETQ